MLINFKKIENIIRLVLVGFKKYKKRLATITLLGFLSGLSGGVGIGAVIPLFSSVSGQGDQSVGQVVFIERLITGTFNLLGIPFAPISVIILIVFLFIFKGFVQFLARYTTSRITIQFAEETRVDLIEKTFRSSWSHLMSQKIGKLETILIQDIQASSNLFSIVSGFILVFTSFVTYVIVAFAISAQFTLLAVALGAVFLFVLKPVYYKIRKLSEFTADIQKMSTHHISQYTIGIKAVESMGSENSLIEERKKYFSKIKEAAIRSSLYKEASAVGVEPATALLIALLFIFSYKSLGFNLITFGIIIYLIQKIFSFIQMMQNHIQDINVSIPYLAAVLDYRQSTGKNIEEDAGRDDFVFNNSIDFKNVSFSYDSEKYVLSSLNLSVKKGEMIGLIGPSGAGKTTVVDLILRLLVPGEGAIFLDNKNINNISLKKWREKIGYVPQDIFLTNDSIRNNIRFYDESVSEDDIVNAAKMANIYETIMELPSGFDSIAGERGVKLSGGQKQRIVLARALARNPEILILDEATSAIDSESEKLIQESIVKLRGRMTIFIIAHRPSTVVNCDRLIVLDNGGVLEEGTPEKLINSPESYFSRMQ